MESENQTRTTENTELKKALFLIRGAKYLLFDMDGTLVNSIGVWNAIDDAVIEAIRGDGLKGIGAKERNRRDEIIQNFPRSANPYVDYCNWLRVTYRSKMTTEEIVRFRAGIAHDYLATRVDYKPHADVLLKRFAARGYILAIVSTTNRANMTIHRTENRNLLEKAPLDDIFSLIVTREDGGALKPDPALYLTALDRLAASPSECVAFEDTLVGVRAAKAATIPCIAVPDPYSECDRVAIRALADTFISDYGELLPYFQ